MKINCFTLNIVYGIDLIKVLSENIKFKVIDTQMFANANTLYYQKCFWHIQP